MILGEFRVKDFLERTSGEVRGRQLSDAKDRYYEATYTWRTENGGMLAISPRGRPAVVKMPAVIELDESAIAFFGLYSGDGAKGSENAGTIGRIHPSISFSQREANLIRFAVAQFRRIFPEARFTFSLGEDSAYFMAGEGLQELVAFYGGALPATPALVDIRPELSDADSRYLREKRTYQKDCEADLAFYYHHLAAMEKILAEKKHQYITGSGIVLTDGDKVVASLRRPYKKGARDAGGSSRSDETHVGNVTGMGELFLKMMHEIEASVLTDQPVSPQGLVVWRGVPSEIGEQVDVKQFFETSNYGKLAGFRPAITVKGTEFVEGLWPRSKRLDIRRYVRLDPLWCYTSGLYLAEGTTDKKLMFEMFQRRVSGMGIGFTSSENTSLELMLRSLQKLFPSDQCVDAWKVKVGSQYFPELVVVGLKNGVPMLRGGNSGDGKMRTMEISLAIKDWGLELTPCMKPYQDKFSHVEPTGAGVPRVDFWASSALCKWYFPLVMYVTFGAIVDDPSKGFAYA